MGRIVSVVSCIVAVVPLFLCVHLVDSLRIVQEENSLLEEEIKESRDTILFQKRLINNYMQDKGWDIVGAVRKEKSVEQ